MSKIKFVPIPLFSDEYLGRNRTYSRSLGLPNIGEVRATARNLAVVGGSPDVRQHLDELRSFDGDIWAINWTYRWLTENGIESTFYRTDAAPMVEDDIVRPFGHAILADCVHPGFFRRLLESRYYVELIPLGSKPGEFQPSTTAAASAVALALYRGYRHVTYYGCASSFGEQTHAYKAENPNLVWVECGGEEYVTSPQMIMQAEDIAEAAREFPQYITIAGGGFLKALAEHGDYNVTHVSPAIDRALKEPA